MDGTRTIRSGDLARLQSSRASAQAWVDQCEVDIMEAKQKLDKLLEEQRQARESLQERDEELRAAGITVALRRVG